MTSNEANAHRGDLAALSALAARLDPNLRWRPVRQGGAGMFIGDHRSKMTTTIRIIGEMFMAEVEPGQPPIEMVPMSDPSIAAERVARMLAPAVTA